MKFVVLVLSLFLSLSVSAGQNLQHRKCCKEKRIRKRQEELLDRFASYIYSNEKASELEATLRDQAQALKDSSSKTQGLSFKRASMLVEDTAEQLITQFFKSVDIGVEIDGKWLHTDQKKPGHYWFVSRIRYDGRQQNFILDLSESETQVAEVRARLSYEDQKSTFIDEELSLQESPKAANRAIANEHEE
jgi:hypothetical protein